MRSSGTCIRGGFSIRDYKLMYQVSVPRGRCEGSITSVKTHFQRPYGCTSVLIAAQRPHLYLRGPKGLQNLLCGQRQHKKESFKIRQWQHSQDWPPARRPDSTWPWERGVKDFMQRCHIWRISRQNRTWKLVFCGPRFSAALRPDKVHSVQPFGPHLFLRGHESL